MRTMINWELCYHENRKISMFWRESHHEITLLTHQAQATSKTWHKKWNLKIQSHSITKTPQMFSQVKRNHTSNKSWWKTNRSKRRWPKIPSVLQALSSVAKSLCQGWCQPTNITTWTTYTQITLKRWQRKKTDFKTLLTSFNLNSFVAHALKVVYLLRVSTWRAIIQGLTLQCPSRKVTCCLLAHSLFWTCLRCRCGQNQQF